MCDNGDNWYDDNLDCHHRPTLHTNFAGRRFCSQAGVGLGIDSGEQMGKLISRSVAYTLEGCDPRDGRPGAVVVFVVHGTELACSPSSSRGLRCTPLQGPPLQCMAWTQHYRSGAWHGRSTMQQFCPTTTGARPMHAHSPGLSPLSCRPPP